MRSRRVFFGSLAAPFVVASGRLFGANSRIRIGVIGCGKMGQGHLHAISDQPDAEISVLCDVYAANLDAARVIVEKRMRERGVKNPALRCVRDFRDVLGDRSLDAVLIATPDHWHAHMAVEACKAGKDVFVEKPMAHDIAGMLAMSEAQQKYGRVVWSGQMQHCWNNFQEAVRWVQSGKIGAIAKCHTWLYWGMPDMGRPPVVKPPKELGDWGWEMWCGPAGVVPFRWDMFLTNPADDPKHEGWSTWRLFLRFGTGMWGDWGAHSIAPLLWGMLGPYLVPENEVAGIPKPGSIGPVVKMTMDGGIKCATDFRDAPDTFTGVFDFGSFALTWEHDACRPEHKKKRSWGMEFIGDGSMELAGEGGRVFVDREVAQLTDENDKVVQEVKYDHRDRRWELFLQGVRDRNFDGVCAIKNVGLGNLLLALGITAYKAGVREAEWDMRQRTCLTPALQPHLAPKYAKPWERLIV